jgi:FAD/FMN-containing dehydrogenase
MRRAAVATPTGLPVLPRLAAIVGQRHVIVDADAMQPHLVEWRDVYVGRAQCVVKPASTDEVAAVMRLADECGVPVVPQGGNTGAVGGQTPDASGRAIVLSLQRLNRIREVDEAGSAIVAEAGVTLKQVQDTAEGIGKLFPLSLASEGSCTIGGNLASNAGGTAVLHYGNMRDLALGLEVVLADGRVWNGLTRLRKDNTGYDLRHLMIGSEGTLGVITAASLRLFPAPKARATAFVGVPSPAAALSLLRRCETAAAGQVTTFELICRLGIDMVLTHVHGTRDPLGHRSEWYVMAEISGSDEAALAAGLEEALAGAFEAGEAEDATIATSLAQRQMFWKIREDLPLAQGGEGGSIKHDISVPVSSIPAFIEEATAMLLARYPGCRPCPFGHMGDGNLHFNVTQPAGMDKTAWLALYEEMNVAVYGIVQRFNGSIAAEHGVGQMKRALLPRFKDPVALDMMRAIKRALDPKGILNPGKVL